MPYFYVYRISKSIFISASSPPDLIIKVIHILVPLEGTGSKFDRTTLYP